MLNEQMQDWLSGRVEASPEKIALIIGEQSWTYADLNKAVADLAAKLYTSGIRSGERIAVWMPSGFEYVCLIHACIRVSVILIPLNTRQTTSETNDQLQRARCNRLIVNDLDEDATQELAAAGIEVIDFSTLSELPSKESIQRSVEITLNDPFAIIHTSGTSGRPKGAVLTNGNFFYSAMASAYHIGILPQDRWLCVLPLYHVGGLSIILRSCLYGTAVDLVGYFDVDTINHALCTQPITLVSLVPTMLHRLIEQGTPERWTDRLRLILLGGAAASIELLERCQQLGIPVATTYGMTEAASQVATMLPEEVHKKPGSVGKPLMFTSVRVADEQGKSIDKSEYGEIVVSGLSVMQGYDNDGAATSEALRNGELYTGDIGLLDADGDLWIVQRRSDLIVSGGENVYPAEVEKVLQRHPAVKEVCVVGVEHAEWGQQVAVVIALLEGEQLTEEALLEYSRQHLAGYKQPRLIKFVDALPQTASGKIERNAVKSLFEADHEIDP